MEFFVSSSGRSVVKLLKSSGNEELDAIAISTCEKWSFHPAEENHKAIDSKVRIHIQFEVK